LLISEPLRLALAEAGVATLYRRPFNLPDNTVFEPPCSIKRIGFGHSFALGAFSFAESGYYFGVRIGRYTSIGENVQIGRGSHPIAWATTSPLFYENAWNVFNQSVPEAEGFVFEAPPRYAKITTIGHDVRIGHSSLISQGVNIGDGAVVMPFSTVSRDVPPYAIVEGNPATVTQMRFGVDVIARTRNLAWWRYAFWDLSGAPVGRPEAFLDHVEIRIAQGIQPYAPALIDVRLFGKALAEAPKAP
jgi:acetyltransferase-like isoleucine patch superfamily enzyme